MNFSTYLNEAWNDHASRTREVADSYQQGLSLVSNSSEFSQLLHLLTHVYGEHLNQWDQGIGVLKILGSSRWAQDPESHAAAARSIATLQLAQGYFTDISQFSTSDQVRILAGAAGALSGTDDSRAEAFLKEAIDKSFELDDPQDPAFRAVAATGNNLAASLEQKSNRTEQEADLMVFAAQTGRKFWEKAGTWSQVALADYRLSQSYLQAGRINESLQTAAKCLNRYKENEATAVDYFYAYEALALAQRAKNLDSELKESLLQMSHYYQQMAPEDQKFSESALQKFNSITGG